MTTTDFADALATEAEDMRQGENMDSSADRRIERTMKVLIVDHEPQRLYDTARVLQSAGHQVLGAATGNECMRTAREKLPDLILLDAALPDISGIDLAQEIKRDPELAHPFVVLLSAEEMPPSIRARALESAADGHIVRTVPKRELSARVEAMLRRKREEKALRVSAQGWNDAFDAISDAVYLVDLENRILNCNLAMVTFLGKPRSEIIGSHCYELVHGTSQPIENCLHQVVQETRRRETLVVPMEDRWLKVAVDPIFDGNDNLIGSVHILSDITERKLAVETLSQAHAELEELVEEQRAALIQAEEASQAEKADRQQVEEALDQAHAKLDKQAQDNLTALARIQEGLQAEVAKRQQTEEALSQAQKQVEEHRTALAQVEGTLQGEVAQREEVEKARSQARKQLEEYRAALARSEETLQTVAADRQQVKEALAQAQAELATRAEEHQFALAKGDEVLQVELAERQRVEEELSQAQAELERQTDEHRAALAKGEETLQFELAERQRTEESLSQLRAELEKQSEEHRMALAQAEEALQAEAGERQRTEKEFSQARAEWEEQAERYHQALAQASEALQTQVAERQQLEATLNQSSAEVEKHAEEHRAALAHMEQVLQAEVSDHMRAEKALRSATDLIYEWDIESGRIEFFSDEGAKLYGDSSEFPKTIADFQQSIHPEDRQRVHAAIARHLLTEEPFSEEYRVLRQDGQVSHWMASGTALWDENGRPLKWIGTATDITTRKLAEQEQQGLATQLNQALRMEAVARLAGGLAQKFNNLLTVILGNAEVAMAQVEPSYAVYRELAAIQRTARQAVTLTQQLLAISREPVAHLQALDLNGLITGFSKVLRRLVGEQVDLEVKLAPQLKPVLADADALEQVLMNLAENAHAAMPHGGTLRIETEQVTLDGAYCQSHPGARAGEYARLTVADTGTGTDEEVQAHLFEPFAVAEEPGEGSGLNLAVVHGIVRQHGGLIDVYSQPGGGTAFEIHLPLHGEE
jgi:PAS domain S-box-containing protein